MSDGSAIEWTDATKGACSVSDQRDGGIRWKHCTACKVTHPVTEFGRDASRGDGLAACCLASRRVKVRTTRTRFKRHGWLVEARDGDKKQARRRVNYLVEQGRLQPPNDVPCVDCGHVWAPGEKRHEYDHHLGYSAEHQVDVESVCTTCHHNREARRAAA